ncbi:hypothetical protein C2S53_005186 [Perilla frutescens var. hirtella]|uniref:Malectin-like domain-containing protein n=1 Tax=Perilla frutescens var. hirtella TaxID=608512 RepID=A0AAD4JMH3_PERFH|nr:hypothetical protein C2S53_005186 [Perilla frutescens var. hirtella]
MSADVFISIDCGSSTSYKDENGIAWTGDDKYVKTGESRSVQSSNSFSHVADTLRVFTNKSKNCYNIDSVMKGRVLVRATFHYGNYDGKSSPPTFDLQFDGNKWGSVTTLDSLPFLVELTYVMKRDFISVCVAQTETDQFPFISALEIRSLELSMYSAVDVNYPLFTRRRVAFGTNATIRFPEDPYDRLWRPDVFINDTIKVSSDALLSSGLTKDNPPPAVLKTAATAATPNSTIDFFMAFPSSDVPTYINWYFSEVTRLKPNQTRSFYIYKDNLPYSPPILPPYQNCTELYASNLTVFANTTFSLVPAKNSTLPPLVNAMEVFRIGDYPLTDGTNDKDVRSLASLQKTFSLLQDWSGDPCLPSGYEWDWVKCNGDIVPRVTTLFLGGYGLSGLLPDLSSMDALQTIDLHNNNLQGNIPPSLGALPNLKILNLENNNLNGTIPASLSTKKGLILRVGGNPGLCASNTSCSIQAPASNSSPKKKNILEMLFATIISIIVLQLS